MHVKYNYYKWFVWSLLSSSFIIVFIHRFGTAVIADDLARALHLTGTQLSNLAGMNLYAYAVMQIPSGVMVDYIGPRKTAAGGMLLAGFGSLWFSNSTTIVAAFMGRLIVGLGVSVIFVSLMKIQSEWFKPTEFSTISGLTSLVGNLGSIIATTPLALLALWIGWRQSFRYLGYISLVACVFIFLLVRNKPSELGFVNPHGELELDDDIPLWEGVRKVLKNRYTWPSFFTLGGFVAPVMTFLGVWGISYLMQVHNLSKEAASGYTFNIALGIMIGGPVIGRISDKLGMKRNLLLGSAVIYTAIWIVVVCWGEYISLILYPIIFFAIGFLNIVHLLAFTNVKEVNHPRLTGIATSVINAGEFTLAAIVNLLTGVILDLFWQGEMIEGVRFYSVGTYKIGFSLFILCGFMAIVSAYLMKEKKDIVLANERK